MSNPIQALNENFFYNSMLARALVQLLPGRDRPVMRIWLDKLHEMDASSDEMQTRNDYMWFMLIMLQSKKRTAPFNDPPPKGDLPPLREILPPNVYEEVLTASDQNMSWVEQAENANDQCRQEPLSSPPAEFFDNQPLPRNGIICYMAAFSDHDY